MSRKKKTLNEFSTEDWACIHSIAHSALGIAGILECDLKDIKQDLAIRLIRTVHHFRPRKSTWATYRGTVLRQELTRIIRNRIRPGFRYMRSAQFSLDEPFSCAEGDNSEEAATRSELINEDGLFTDGTEKDEIPNMNLQIDMADFLHKLPIRLRKICISLLSRNVAETARYLKLSPRSLYRRINEIRMLMIEAGFETYIYPQNVTL